MNIDIFRASIAEQVTKWLDFLENQIFENWCFWTIEILDKSVEIYIFNYSLDRILKNASEIKNFKTTALESYLTPFAP